MANEIGFNLDGVPELNAKLAEVSEDVKFKGGRFALRKAANLVRDNARQQAARVDDPLTPEEIEKNIVVRWSGSTFRKTGNLHFRVGILGGAKGHAAASGEVSGQGAGNPGGDTYYWRFLEFGTAKMPAQPFMRPALAESIGAVSSEFITQYKKAIDRAIKRAQRQGGG